MPERASKLHEREAAASARHHPVRCAVLTVSDTRTLQNDVGGALILTHLVETGHIIAARAIVPDEPAQIAEQVQRWLKDPNVQAIISTGGTGIARRDTTIEVVRRMLTIELEGFGELFRMLSYEQVKGAAMLSRAVAGLVLQDSAAGGDTFLFAIPGSPNAVETAMSNLIAPQLAHLVWERRR